MNCSLPGSFVHGILQARILEWVAIPFSRGSSWPKNEAWVSCIAGGLFTSWATKDAFPSPAAAAAAAAAKSLQSYPTPTYY